MVTNGLHILLLPQGLALNLLASVGDGNHGAEDFINHVHLAFTSQGNGIANPAAVDQLVAVDHFHQLQDDAFSQCRICFLTGNQQFRTPKGDGYAAFLLDERNILVIHAEKGHVSFHGVRRQIDPASFCQKASQPFLPY